MVVPPRVVAGCSMRTSPAPRITLNLASFLRFENFHNEGREHPPVFSKYLSRGLSQGRGQPVAGAYRCVGGKMRTSHMARVLVVLLVVFGLLVTTSHAQSTNATVGGQITDEQGRVVLGVTVVLTNLNTGVTYEAKTNGDGIYSAPNLPPGIYRANVTKDGFKSIVKGDIELHVQDVASINFQLQVGSVTETVTVEGGTSMINTTDASVSTVVDQTYVKNMPLNGRSFQDLILLTPGVVTSGQGSNPGRLGQTGEVSVNGQRPEENNYTIDGVSANVGAA